MKRLKRPMLVLLGLALILSTTAGIWATWNMLSSSRYEESLRLFREAGLPTSPRDLAPAPVPDAENAAPLYLEAIDQAAGIENFRLGSCRELPQEARKAVASADGALELVHRAAGRAYCVFESNHDDPSSASVLSVARFMKLARVLVARSVFRSEDGELDGAVDDLHALFHMARSLGQEPMLLRQVVRLSISGMGLEALEVILPRCDSAADVLQEVELDVARGAIARGMRGEAGLGTELLLRDSLDPADFGDTTSLLYWTVRMRSVTGPYLKSEAATYLDFIRRFSEALQKSYPVAIAEARTLEDELQEDAGLLLGTVVVRAAGMVKREASIASKLALAPLAARCLDHRRLHGGYPRSLSEVATADEVIDPFSGEPFLIVERPDGGITLASPQEGGGSWRLPGGKDRE